jgi:hypothetical protein
LRGTHDEQELVGNSTKRGTMTTRIESFRSTDSALECVYCGLIDCPSMNRGQHRRAGECLITEADVDTDGLYPSDEELDDERADWEYWEDVRSCCGGRVWGCTHWGSYPPPREWPEP